jgi:hypothetical protein
MVEPPLRDLFVILWFRPVNFVSFAPWVQNRTRGPNGWFSRGSDPFPAQRFKFPNPSRSLSAVNTRFISSLISEPSLRSSLMVETVWTCCK